MRWFDFAFMFVHTPSSDSLPTFLGAFDQLVVNLVVHQSALDERVLLATVRAFISL